MLEQQASSPNVADVFISEQLARRVPKKTDYLQEKLALQELAARMVDRPEDVLPKFVDLALEMTDGISAGLSLYEENPFPGVFRWRYLRGLLAPFEGATTPRNFSPCGITLDRNAPVLSARPERVYNWIADANISVPEVLLVPLYLGGTTPLGTLWIVSGEEDHFDSGHARVMTELASFVGIALRMTRSEQRLRQALDEQETLAREMSHRVNNLFMIADGMIRIGARAAVTKDELAEDLSGRLSALAAAHALVRPSFKSLGEAPPSLVLADLIRAIAAPHETPQAPRFSIEGPSIECSEHAINGLALVFHELATNAAKYGALKTPNGRIDIDWKSEDGRLLLRWVERGGPPVTTAPATESFGSTLLRDTVTRRFDGTLDYEWRREGMAATITIPMDRLCAETQARSV